MGATDERRARVAWEDGTSEVVEFFGPSTPRLFGCAHLPGRPTGGALVICPSLHAELLSNYRREVLLARALAARGLAVYRFHYRGMGHSDGEPADTTLESMVEDARAATARCLEMSAPAAVAFMGTRLGAVVAAAAAAPMRDAPIVLWEPILEPVRFFRDAIRAHLLSGLEAAEAAPTPAEAVMNELESVGWVDVLGHPLYLRLYRSLAGITLEGQLGAAPRAVLMAQLSSGRSLSRAYADAVAGWARRGFEVDVELAGCREDWWLMAKPAPCSQRVISRTAEWLLHRGAGGART